MKTRNRLRKTRKLLFLREFIFTGTLLVLTVVCFTACQLRLARTVNPENSSPSTDTTPQTTETATSTTTTPAPSSNNLLISPTTRSVVTYNPLNFSATGGNPPLSFQLSSGGGALDSLLGLFTAPGIPGSATVKVVDSLGYASTSTLTIIAPTKIATGAFHTCAALSNGSVQCWGANASGQLGNGSTLNQDTPVYVSGISNAVDISVGNSHSCAILSTGSVQCWGHGTVGELGDGLATSSSVPVTVSGISSALAVGLTNYSPATNGSCALISGGTIKCWGYGASGQLGDGGATQRNTPVSVSGITTAIALAVGGVQACALLASGSIQCWGSSSFGELGNGATSQQNTPVSVSGITTAIAIAAGYHHTCAILTGGTVVKCWGENSLKGLGDGTTTNRNTPVVVTILPAAAIVTQIAAGNAFTCATLNDGSTQCWGNRLEDYSGYSTSQPISIVVGLTGTVKVAAGLNHACALQSDNRVKCWGQDTSGQLGTNLNHDRSTVAVTATGISNTISVSTGYSHGCAVLTGGSVKCWGLNSSGQLGDGTTISKWTPVAVSGITNAVSVTTGMYDSCAVLSTGTVKCWGLNVYGELGDGTITQRLTPVSVSGITTATAVSMNFFNTCALLSSGSIQCWGMNWYGEVGNGTGSPGVNQLTPVTVSGITTATAISVGDYHSCAVLSSGTVKCWGMGSPGQLGDGLGSDSLTPVSVSGITTAVAIAASSYRHSCAVLADGSVKCWGGGGSGQLGDGLATNSTVPVTVSGISNATTVTGGSRSSCARLSTGGVKCWGRNVEGQLGDGTMTQRNTPVAVSGVSNATAVTDLSNSTCALLSTGSVQCWGYNANGQLGDGTGGAYPTSAPVQVGPWQ